MNCKKCDFELVQGQDICPRCGASQMGTDDNSQGISMELPPMGSSNAAAVNKPANSAKSKAEASKEKTEAAKKTVKEAAQKAKKSVEKTAKKVKKVSKETADSIGDAAQDVAETAKNGGSKAWLYAIIGVAAAVVLLIVGYLVIAYEPKGAEKMQSVILAATEDEVFLVEGDQMTSIIEIPEGIYAREIITPINSNSFYLISDAEYDEDIGEPIGDLLYLKANGKDEEIDSDVIVGSQKIVGGILWYERADKDEKIVCCYDGKKITEVIAEEELNTWIGTDKAGKAYYTLMDKDDYATEVFVAENDDSESIMDEAQIITVSSDFKKLLLSTEDKGETTIHIFDGKDDFEVMDDVQDVVVGADTFDMLVIADADDMVLYYIPYGKEEIEIDDEVEEIVPLSMSYYKYSIDNLGDKIYYGKDDDLYVADFKGKETERILKNYEDTDVIGLDEDTKVLTYVDDDEVIMFNLDNLKEESVELPDANDLSSYDIAIVGNWYVYRTDENKEIFAYSGKGDAIELFDDGEEVIDFEAFMDKYVIWQNIDDELILSQMKEDTAEEIGDDVYSFWPTEDGQIYFLSDYEDGEGDLYYIAKAGKDAEKIEKNITNLFFLYYE